MHHIGTFWATRRSSAYWSTQYKDSIPWPQDIKAKAEFNRILQPRTQYSPHMPGRPM